MRHTLIAVVMVVGCKYSEPSVPGGDDDTGPDAGANVPRDCPNDSTLRLCVPFDGALSPTVEDGMSHTVTAANIGSTTRAGDPAAHLDATSELFIAPGDAGDLDNLTNLTIEMWMSPDHKPAMGQVYWMLNNNNEYGIEYKDDGKVRCVVGDHTVDSMMMVMVPPGGWIHVACTYDQQRLIVLVDGNVDNCLPLTDAIPTIGADGVAIGANLGAGPVFDDRFLGGLDNVRIYDRSLDDIEICAIAGHGTSCQHMCPGGGGDDWDEHHHHP